MTDFRKCSSHESSNDHLITRKDEEREIKNNILKNSFKLSLNRKNGYTNILSRSIEDFSLISDDTSPLEQQTNENHTTSPNGSQNADTKWFKTWPERCDKIKLIDTSPTFTLNPHEGSNTLTSNKLTLNEALKQSISLAYNPITKQLHIVDDNTTVINNGNENCSKTQSNDAIVEKQKLGHRRIPDGSYSSTISTLSDPSTSCSLIGSDDRSLYNFDEENNNKIRRKSLSSFFSKNVFSWKSNDNDTNTTTTDGDGNGSSSSNTNSIWKFFTKQPSETNNSPVHTVASSSALIQLKRPSSLPAKTLKEEQKHAQEYNEIIAAAKKREAKNTAAKDKLKKIQLKQEEQQAASAKHFSQIVLPNWNQMEKHKKTQVLWWQGLPSSVRGKVWRLAIGNELNITMQLYEICLIRAQNRLSSPEPSIQNDCEENQESSMDVIELDISRTFPNLGIFQEGGPFSDILHSLLAAYVCFRPDVGYVQGMSYIAAILILNMEPCDAFICFANLLNQPLHLSAFRLNQNEMKAYYNAYNRVLSNNLPKLYAHFENAGLTPDLYLLDWIYTIFAKAMPLDVACRVWDLFLRDGYEFIFRTALGVLHLYQSILLTMDFLHGAQFLTKLPEDISADQLFKSIQYVSTNIGKITFKQIVEQYSLSDEFDI